MRGRVSFPSLATKKRKTSKMGSFLILTGCDQVYGTEYVNPIIRNDIIESA